MSDTHGEDAQFRRGLDEGQVKNVLELNWFSWFPVYWVAKLAFLVYLWFPVTRGAQRLYKTVLGPAFDRFGPVINETLNRLFN